MILNAYSIYDRKALVYHAPFFAVSHGSAVRSFSDLANDRNTMIGRHPLDYTLFHVGRFEDSNGMLMVMNPEHVSDASNLVMTNDFLPFDNPGKSTNGQAVEEK